MLCYTLGEKKGGRHLLFGMLADLALKKLKGGFEMIKIRENFIADARGNRVGVILNMKQYRKILENLEELDAIRAYDTAKKLSKEVVSFDQAIKEIEKKRK